MSTHTGMVGVTKTYRAEVTITEPKNRSNQMAKKNTPKLPEVNEKGFFQLLVDLKVGDKYYTAGTWMKRLSATASGKTWLVRRRYRPDYTAKSVRTALLEK